jgi:hypothetical protein
MSANFPGDPLTDESDCCWSLASLSTPGIGRQNGPATGPWEAAVPTVPEGRVRTDGPGHGSTGGRIHHV